MAAKRPSDAPLTAAEKKTPAEKPSEPVVPAPEPYQIPKRTGFSRPDLISEYRLADGGLYGVIARWDATEDGPKDIRPLTWNGSRWGWRGFGSSRPMLYLPEIVERATAPVLVVAGEKTCDAACSIVPDGWLVTTWAGGEAVPHLTDWGPLRGRPIVVMWPDNDAAGVKSAAVLEGIFGDLGVPSAIVGVPRGFPDKWDLADEPPADWDAEKLRALLVRTSKQCSIRTEEVEPAPAPKVSTTAADGGGTDSVRAYIPVGYDEDGYWLIARSKQMLVRYTAARLLKKEGPLDLVPDHKYWRKLFNVMPSDSIPWELIGAQIIQQCQSAGPFDPDRVRGRGAWIDEGRIVVHLGDLLLVDGVAVEPVDIVSKSFYPMATRLLDIREEAHLTATEGRKLRELCNRIAWERPIYGDLFAGWLATSTICGALKWRPHGWITGPAGAGKSWVINNIVEVALADLAIYPLGNSSEAGIRQWLERDARPVIYDEAEGRGRFGAERRQQIIELMRSAAQESRGAQAKGGQSHDVSLFKIRSQFLLASIGVGLREAADIGRCVVFTMSKPEGYTDEQKAAREAHFVDLSARAAALPSDLAPKLFLRMAAQVNTIRTSAEVLARAIASKVGDRREGDTLGTLLAGAFALHIDKPVTDAQAEAYVERAAESGAFIDFVRQAETREDLSIMQHMATQIVRVPLPNGGTTDRAIGELGAVAIGRAQDDRFSSLQADDALRRYGIRASERTGFFIAHNHPELDNLMRGSDYMAGYMRIIQRHPESVAVEKTMRFHGPKVRATWIPAEMLLGEDDFAPARPGEIPDIVGDEFDL